MKIRLGETELDAAFEVEMHNGDLTVVFASRSGKRGSSSARHVDYEPGLEILLERLAALDATVSQIRLHPANGNEGSRLTPHGYTFPLALRRVIDLRQFRRALSRAQQQTDREPGAKGSGNPTKRIRIHVAGPRHGRPEQLETELATGRNLSPVQAPRPTVEEAFEVLAASDMSGAPPDRQRSTPSPIGQGMGLTASERRAVERRAVTVAVEHFENEGWSVRDVGNTESFDLVCEKDGVELHVEVKGTTGAGERIILPRNEVLHARRYPHVALAVVSEVRLVKGVPPVAEAGALRVRAPWTIDDGDLEPLAFYYSVGTTPRR
jgi:hypothetical protein